MTDGARTDAHDLFEPVLEYPDEDARERYHNLVGVDDIKDRLLKEASLRLDPGRLERWSRAHHGAELLPAARLLLRRPPVFILAGDVGTGKTALAETIGDPIARELGIPVFCHRLSLAARGSGLVGQASALIRDAFATVADAAARVTKSGKVRSGFLLVVDEADALAQSRDEAQMHHEDRAGVNSLIRGINDITERGLPVVVLLCTNRLDAIDPAIRRRAAEPFNFARPNAEQRAAVLKLHTADLKLTGADLVRLVEITGPGDGTPGFTYSDLTDRLLPAAVLAAVPNEPLTGDLLIRTALDTSATPPFGTSLQGADEAHGLEAARRLHPLR